MRHKVIINFVQNECSKSEHNSCLHCQKLRRQSHKGTRWLFSGWESTISQQSISFIQLPWPTCSATTFCPIVADVFRTLKGSAFNNDNRCLCLLASQYIYFMSFERDELDGKYSLIGCRNTCVLLCMLLSCLAQTLECCLHCMSQPVIGQGMPVFKWLAVNRWSLSATFRGGKQVCLSF